MNPIEAIDAGRPALDAVLGPSGFEYLAGTADVGSGGAFVQGSYTRASRRLTFSYRRGLGEVLYWLDGSSLDHATFVRAVSRGARIGRYPGFPADPLDSFAAVAADIEEFGAPFLSQESTALREVFAWAASHPTPTGMAALDRGAV